MTLAERIAELRRAAAAARGDLEGHVFGNDLRRRNFSARLSRVLDGLILVDEQAAELAKLQAGVMAALPLAVEDLLRNLAVAIDGVAARTPEERRARVDELIAGAVASMREGSAGAGGAA
jgi:hypothetical protein